LFFPTMHDDRSQTRQQTPTVNIWTSSQNASPQSARISGTLFALAYGIFSYFSFIIFKKMLFFIFWPLPEKLLDCRKRYFARLWGAAATPMPACKKLSGGVLASVNTYRIC